MYDAILSNLQYEHYPAMPHHHPHLVNVWCVLVLSGAGAALAVVVVAAMVVWKQL